ncbi:hypothetical protein AW27_023030 [Streptomyces sp. PCS3-D2]|uniref:hypothetical protein n=1 Tax=Streptomyces sp. PCS3-D2 TaxID=1460244 RepID=UPI00044EBB7C|nr:hypothetical protein [Streptomyces sp. PCS3-D2]WKV74119.1 hypothetical protein AW27_023030 [Streptomyces sp. PCS3-D2]
MTDTTTALRIALDGQVREYDLGADRSQQYRVVGRALFDSAEAVEHIERPEGPSIVVLARVHRAGQPLNPWAAAASDALESQITQPVAGEVLFIGYLSATDTITSLPEDAAALIREACNRP